MHRATSTPSRLNCLQTLRTLLVCFRDRSAFLRSWSLRKSRVRFSSPRFSVRPRLNLTSSRPDDPAGRADPSISAPPAGSTKASSGLSGIAFRVRGRSTMPSIMMRATWTPSRARAYAPSISARLRCAALAGAKAADLMPPRRKAVAPMKMMFPERRAFKPGMTSRAQSRAP